MSETEANRCEAIKPVPFALGGTHDQCRNDATFVVEEKCSGQTMFICDTCRIEFDRRNKGDEHKYTFTARASL